MRTTPLKNSKINSNLSEFLNRRGTLAAILLVFAMSIGGCNAHMQTKVSGNLNQLSRNMTVAILPVGTTESGQNDAARLLRRDLYASLKQSRFHVLERYIVDGLLKQNNLSSPEDFNKISPIQLGEILGTDAVLTSTMTKVKRSYFILHSSIELGVKATLTDTRTGEILWMADQTETDFDGIGKIPTGIISALLAPIHFVTNKVNLRRMTHKLSDKLMALVKKPDEAAAEEQFDSLVVASTATEEIRNITKHSRPGSPKTSPEAYRFSPDHQAPVSVSTSRKTPAAAMGPLPVAKAVQSTARPNRQPTTVSRPAAFSSITTDGPPPNEVQLAALQAASSRITRKNPQPKVPETADQKFTPIALAKNEPLSRPTGVSLQPKPMATNNHNVTAVAVMNTSTPKYGEIKTAIYRPKTKATDKFASIQPATANISNTVYYTVQVGAYETKSFAKTMISKLTKKGYHAFLTPFKKGRSLLYKVQVEKFTDKKKAYLYARNLSTREKIDNFVTKVKTS